LCPESLWAGRPDSTRDHGASSTPNPWSHGHGRAVGWGQTVRRGTDGATSDVFSAGPSRADVPPSSWARGRDSARTRKRAALVLVKAKGIRDARIVPFTHVRIGRSPVPRAMQEPLGVLRSQMRESDPARMRFYAQPSFLLGLVLNTPKPCSGTFICTTTYAGRGSWILTGSCWGRSRSTAPWRRDRRRRS
jgi:hypothetical protein